MNGLTWFQALAFAKLQRRAIRRAAWERWVVYRHHGWYTVRWVEGVEGWSVPLNTELTGADYQARDWTTEPWAGGALPACCPADQPSRLAGNATGGAQSWGPLEDCGLALTLGAGTTGGGATGGSGVARPVLDVCDVRVRAEIAPYPSGITTGTLASGGPLGYTMFPLSYLGAVEVDLSFALATVRANSRVYVWLGVDEAPDGPQGVIDFEADNVGRLEGAYGPVRASESGVLFTGAGATEGVVGVAHGYRAGYVYANDGAEYQDGIAAGVPAAAFTHVALQPGTIAEPRVLHVRVDVVDDYTGRTTFRRTHTLPSWVQEPAVIEWEAYWDPEADGESFSLGDAETFTVDAGTDVLTTALGVTVGDTVRASSSGTLPAGLAVDTTYWVRSTPSAGTLTLSTTEGGAVLNITDTGSGTHTLTEYTVLGACWTGGGPGSISLLVGATVTGGKTGAGTITLAVDGVTVVSPTASRTASYGGGAGLTYEPSEVHTYAATWSQPADVYGPAVEVTDDDALAMPPEC